jgi:hypothetical protein
MSEDTERWSHLTSALAIRSGSRCEWCWEPFVPGVREPSRHHRLGGQMGGRKHNPDHDTLPNLMLLCGGRLAGVMGCHGYITAHPAAAYTRGYLVRSGTDPAAVPVTLPSGRRVLLDAYGRYEPAPGGEWITVLSDDTPTAH